MKKIVLEVTEHFYDLVADTALEKGQSMAQVIAEEFIKNNLAAYQDYYRNHIETILQTQPVRG